MKTRNALPLVAMLLTSVVSLNSHADYSLKGESVAGSRLPTTLAQSAVPFNKNYQQFNATQRSAFRKGFSSLSVNQNPPFPLRGLQAIYRPIAKLGLNMDVQGTFNATATVNQNGIVETVTVHQSPSSALSVKVTRLLQKTHFQPASCASQSCAMQFPIKVSFL